MRDIAVGLQGLGQVPYLMLQHTKMFWITLFPNLWTVFLLQNYCTEILQNLVESLPRRVEAVVRYKDGTDWIMLMYLNAVSFKVL